MEIRNTAKTIARWATLISLFLITLAPLIVVNSFFFPFITGKTFFFRILVEIALSGYILLAFLDAEYRPRFSWIGIAVIAFVSWMFVADLFAQNMPKAFWSNFERMEGWILLIHLLAFFFVASNVLRVEKQWRNWFLTSLGVGFIVSMHGVMQQLGWLPIHQGATRIDSSFGNSEYFAVYLLFNTFFAIWLGFTEQRWKWLKYTLYAFAVLEAVLIFFTETRGAVLALAGGLVLAGLLVAWSSGPRARKYALAGIAIVLILGGGLYAARGTSFVQHDHVLQRISSISLKAGQTRFTIWGMAFQGIGDRLATGWGQGGFNFVFDRYYKPSLYNQEPWFDRAHNVFIDWLVEGGVPGFIFYFSLFVSVVWLLWKRPEISRAERTLLLAALLGYVINNMFVFDNLYSYIYFFTILAFVDARVGRPVAWFAKQPNLDANDGLIYGVPAAVIVAGLLVWFVNVPSIQACSELITAITPSQTNLQQNYTAFESLLKHPSYPWVQETREQLVSFTAQLSQDPSIPSADLKKFGSLAVSEMQKQVTAHPLDTRELLELSYAYNAIGDPKNALSTILEAGKTSPGKEEIWIQAGATEVSLGNYQAAKSYFDKAYQLGPQFAKLASYAAAGDYLVGQNAAGDKILLNTYGTTTVDDNAVALAFYQTKNWPRLIAIYKLRANKPGAGVQGMYSLASVYYAAGEKQKAIAELQAAMQQYPQSASQLQAAIDQLKGVTPTSTTPAPTIKK